MNLKSTSLALFFAAAACSHGAFIAVSLPGTTQYDGWEELTATAQPAYSSAALGSANAAWPEAFGSNAAGSGDALFNKISGGGYFASSGVYQGFSGSGSYTVYDSTALAGLATVVLQFEANYGVGAAPAIGEQPTIYLNGSTTGIAATYTETLLEAGVKVPANSIFAFQWDLSGESTPITSFHIDWTGPSAHGQITGIQLNQGSTFSQVLGVPEPASALLGFASLALAGLRRRRN